MKTFVDYRKDAVREIETHGLVPHNMRVAIEEDHLVIFGCVDEDCSTTILERATCKQLLDGKRNIPAMVKSVRGKIEHLALYMSAHPH